MLRRKPATWNDYVVRDILAHNSYGSKEVKDLRSLKSMFFEKDKYSSIISLIREGNLAAVAEMPGGDPSPEFQEFLEVMQFEDQNGRSFIVTVYDNIELWQDPEVIEVFVV